MSRLDTHVSHVQNKIAMRLLLNALAWSVLIYTGVVLLTVLIRKFAQLQLPREMIWFWSGLGASVVAAVVYAIWRRPSRRQAAVMIDQELNLNEKFSTALFIQPSNDPFVNATLQDAHETAKKLNLQSRFPVRFPRMGFTAMGAAVLVLLTTLFVPSYDLFGVEERREHARQQAIQTKATVAEAKRVLGEIAKAPPEAANVEAIQFAKRTLEDYAQGKTTKDPAKVKSVAQDALREVQALKEKVKEMKVTATAMNDMKMFKSMPSPTDPSTPIGSAQKHLGEGKFEEAVADLQKAVENFNKLEKKDQQKAAQQMNNLAQQMQQMANNPQAQQQMQNALQNLGANKQQAQQMAQNIQQAAQGNQQAQRQLQQQVNQMMQQMNNGQGPNAQQQQQIQQAVQAMQQQAGNQAQAQALAQAAQQMAAAMQQGAQPNQPGQQGGPQQGQAQANAQQQMQNALQQMQAMQQGMQGNQVGQQPGQMAGGQQPGQQPGGQQPGNQQGNQPGGQQGNQQGNQGGPQGGFAVGAGPRAPGQEAPFAVKQELAPSQTNEKGKILASSFVKAPSEAGTSKLSLTEVIESEFNESTDEVDSERTTAADREAVKEYFDAVKSGAPAK